MTRTAMRMKVGLQQKYPRPIAELELHERVENPAYIAREVLGDRDSRPTCGKERRRERLA